jgi:WD40 repeat protein
MVCNRGDTQARCYDLKSAVLKRIFKGHTGLVNSLRVIGKRLFTGSYDGTLRVWDVSDLAPEQSNYKSAILKSQSTRPTTRTLSPTAQKFSIENETISLDTKQRVKGNDRDSGFDDRDTTVDYSYPALKEK